MAKIKIWLLDNPLTKDPTDYSARISPNGAKDLDSLVKGIVKKRSEYQEVSIRAIANLLFDEMLDGVKSGYVVETPWFKISPGITGNFSSKTTSFNKEAHALKFNFNANRSALSELQDAEVEVLGISDGHGAIGMVINTATGEENQSIPTNDAIRIKGKKIKIFGDENEVGVFLIKQSDGERIKLPRVVENMPSELLVLTSHLEPGEYQLEIITRYNGNNILTKNARIIRFDQLLRVM